MIILNKIVKNIQTILKLYLIMQNNLINILLVQLKILIVIFIKILDNYPKINLDVEPYLETIKILLAD